MLLLLVRHAPSTGERIRSRGEYGSEQANGKMMRESREGIQSQEEEVLHDNRGAEEEAVGHGGGFLDSRPG